MGVVRFDFRPITLQEFLDHQYICKESIELIKIVSCILTLDEKWKVTKLLLHGDDRYDSETSKIIILASITFIYSIKRLDGQLV